MTDNRETRIELITAALLIVVFLFYLTGLFRSFAMLMGGLILLGSGVYQTVKGWHVSLLTWILGIVFTLAGLGLRLFLVGVIRIDWVPIVLVVIAAYLVWSWWRKHA